MDSKEEESFQERQENEFTILQSMFPGDIEDLRVSALEIYQPLEFVITILPQQSSDVTKDVHVQVDLHLKCPDTYPETIPDISVRRSKGLSSQEVSLLIEDLNNLANGLCGEVMIYELVQCVQAFLSQHNTPRHGSFYDEMLFNQKQLIENKLKEKEKQEALLLEKETLQRKAIEEEMERKQIALKEESKMKKSPSVVFGEHSPGMFGDVTSPLKVQTSIVRRRSVKSSTPDDDCLASCCEHTGTISVMFSNKINKKIQRGKCLRHKHNDNVVRYAGLDLTTGDYVMITEWNFKYFPDGCKVKNMPSSTSSTEAENILKQLSTVEQELSSLCKLRHNNLVNYVGLKTYTEKDRVVCLILQEFVLGSSLEFYLNQNVPVDYPLLQHHILGILEALAFLHRNSVVHRDLKDTCVFVDNRGLIRVAGYSLEKRLLDIYCTVMKVDFEHRFPNSFGRGGKKGDIYRLGLLCLSLAQGELVNSANPDIPSTFTSSLQDFLEKCLAKQDQDRWSAEQLLEHAFMKPATLHKGPVFQNDILPIDSEKNKGIIEETEISPEQQKLIPIQSSSGQSRLLDEFEVIGLVGKGGFGSVFKARNKLDWGIYAIKCIQLNKNNKQLNRKIMREVKLLSRLNHENVVRYYNSWLETACLTSTAEESEESSTCEEISSNEILKINNLSINPELLQPALNSSLPSIELGGSSSWNMSDSYEKGNEEVISSSEEVEDEDDDDDDDDDEEDLFGTSFLAYSNSSSNIIFEGSATSTASIRQLNESKKPAEELGSVPKLSRLMYIQMEFCDKNTLLDAISNDLYKDEARVWQLFREIVEGLVHIHQQGMIHRDLKPVNLFLDAHNHIKIGDFGLATNIVQDNHIPQPIEKGKLAEPKPISEGTDSDNRTGMVGTTLYIAPEVQIQAVYNQKIDIYSLGIIFFEMCYPPLNTAMEKCRVLSDLRQKEIIFPSDFDTNEKSSQTAIIRWLLNHDPFQRPTSHELLQSRYLPPPQMEEAELQEMLRHTISNPQSKAYKHMISSLLDQEVTAAADVTYDIDMHKGSFSSRVALTQKFVNDTLVKVFERHGAITVNSSFLMPKSNLYEGNEFCVNLVDHGGGVVSLPYDLRVPFSRFVVKNKISFLKRYHIAPVYRERKVYGLHPRTLYEGAFDIITPDRGSLNADAEVLVVMVELFSEFPSLRNRRNFIRLNHTLIVKGILMYCDISEERHNDAFAILKDAKVEISSKNDLIPQLTNTLNVSEHTAVTLCRLFSMEGASLQSISHHIKHNLKKGEARKLIMQGIQELETLLSNLKSLGLNEVCTVTTNLIYNNMHHFSGPIFQFVCELKKKQKKERLDILAAGGRYDQLITKTRMMMGINGSRDASQSAVGVSISVERLVSALLECEEFQPIGSYDVLVCALGRNLLIEERSAIVKDFWNASISAHMLYESLHSLEEIHDLSKELYATYMVILKDSETSICRVRWLDKDKYVERKVPPSDVVDFVSQKIPVLKTKSEVQDSGNECISTGTSQCGITYVACSEKTSAFYKRRQEATIMFHLSSILGCFSSKIHIDIIAVELTSPVVKALAAYLKVDGNEADFQASISKVIELHQRLRKYINNICDEICKAKFEKRQQVVILYGMTDNSYALIA